MAGWQDGGGTSGCNLYVTPASSNRTNGIHMYGVFPLTWRLLMTDVNSVQESLAWRISSVAGC